MLRKEAHLAEMKYMLRIPLGRERVACDSFMYLTTLKVPFNGKAVVFFRSYIIKRTWTHEGK